MRAGQPLYCQTGRGMLAFGTLSGSSSARQSARFGTVRPEVQILSPRPFFCLCIPLEAYFSGIVGETPLVLPLRSTPRTFFRASILPIAGVSGSYSRTARSLRSCSGRSCVP